MIGRRGLVGLRAWAMGGLAVLAILVAAGCGGGGSAPARTAKRSTPAGLVLVRNGLLANDPFNTSEPISSLAGSFRLGGTAGPSDASVRALTDGLHVAVGSRKLGNWTGYFAATASTYPARAVFHVRMWRSIPSAPVTSQTGVALFAVQTGQYNALNYVLVAGVVTRRSAYWAVGHATGNVDYAKTKILWIRRSADTHEDVTLRTDGRSSYAVYFGSKLVYASKALKLEIKPPFRVYLEVEARGIPYQTRFQDLWIASDDAVRIDGLHPGDHVTLAPDGVAPVQAVANAAGQALLPLPLSQAFGNGTLTIDGSGGRRRFAGLAFAGGDVYRVGT